MPFHIVETALTWRGELLLGANWIVATCAITVLTAVLLNFLLREPSVIAVKERKSLVATGTMIGFLVFFWVLIRWNIGVIHISSDALFIICVIMGLALVILGCIVNLLGRKALGSLWADNVTVYSNQQVLDRGIFGVVRHPLYASLIWMYFGVALVYQNYAAFLANCLVFVPAMMLRSYQEEKMLESVFPQYAEYRKRVGRFLPVWNKGERHVS